MIHLRLQRQKTTETFTEGDLYVNGEWFCFTLEDTVRKGKKVYGKTAIPAGTYKVAVTFSNRFQKPMTEIKDVKGFEGIRIHQGMTPTDSLGCVLISKRKGQTPGILAAMKAGILTNQLTEMVKSAKGGEIEIISG
jgi:hypothetical protein